MVALELNQRKREILHYDIVDFKKIELKTHNKPFLAKLRERIDRVGITLPKVEVRYEHLNVKADKYMGGRMVPTLINSTLNIIEVSYKLRPTKFQIGVLVGVGSKGTEVSAVVVEEVVTSLAKYCGKVLEIDDGSITSSSQQCSAMVKIKDLESIPRLITLEERGYFYSVGVVVDFQRLIGIVKKKVAAVPVVNSSFVHQMHAPVLPLGPPISNGAMNYEPISSSRPPGFTGPQAQPICTNSVAFGPERLCSQESNTHFQFGHAPPRSISWVSESPLGHDQSPFVNANHFDALNKLDSSQGIGRGVQKPRRWTYRGNSNVFGFKQLWRSGVMNGRGRSRSKSRPRTILSRPAKSSSMGERMGKEPVW
ncbi:hypothetical protein FRX31_033061, partial [Thalictrum thalictroides]